MGIEVNQASKPDVSCIGLPLDYHPLLCIRFLKSQYVNQVSKLVAAMLV